MKKIQSTLEFLKQVKIELGKLAYPTLKEAMTVSGVVLIVVMIFSLIFLLVDAIVFKFINLFLGIGS